ncbi:MAG: DUF4864 domain-containing protein [Bradyrhizobium sp.]|nr:MAG: DUF4864 domain-containing protein [Bradyrhizobium sp.]
MASVMRGLALVAVLFSALVSGPAGAQSTQEARAIISRQLDAFAHDDAAGAYALVSPGLKMTFTDQDIFIGMVRNHYAPVYRHREVGFGEAQVDGDTISITATLVDDENQIWIALYQLERQPDGQWLINSCKLLTPTESALRPKNRAA